jgi:hypothetical protein
MAPIRSPPLPLLLLLLPLLLPPGNPTDSSRIGHQYDDSSSQHPYYNAVYGSPRKRANAPTLLLIRTAPAAV